MLCQHEGLPILVTAFNYYPSPKNNLVRIFPGNGTRLYDYEHYYCNVFQESIKVTLVGLFIINLNNSANMIDPFIINLEAAKLYSKNLFPHDLKSLSIVIILLSVDR